MKTTINKTGRAVSLFLSLIFLFSFFTLCVSAEEEPNTDRADAAYLYCIENNQVLFSKDSAKTIYPASTVKIMTGILALEYYQGKMDEQITVLQSVINGVSGSNIGLLGGEILSAEQLINALIVGNANDAALVLAAEIGGDIDSFVKLMNDKAKELNAENTRYTNPTGLHNDNMVSTAEDIAKIAVYAYKTPGYADIASQARYTMGKTNKSVERNIHNKNYMLSKAINPNYYTSEVNGLNAGSTEEAGCCLAATKYHGGLTYLCIVMGGDYDEESGDIYSYITAIDLFSWAENHFSYIKVLDSSLIVCEIPVTMSSKTDYVTLLPESSVEIFLPVDTNVKDEVKIEWVLDSETLEAPIASGDKVGVAIVSYKDEIVGRVALITKNSVDSDSYLFVLAYLLNVINSVWFKVIVIILFLIAIAYVLITARLRYLKKEKIRYNNDYYFKSKRIIEENEKPASQMPKSGPTEQNNPPINSKIYTNGNGTRVNKPNSTEKRSNIQNRQTPMPNRPNGDNKVRTNNVPTESYPNRTANKTKVSNTPNQNQMKKQINNANSRL